MQPFNGPRVVLFITDTLKEAIDTDWICHQQRELHRVIIYVIRYEVNKVEESSLCLANPNPMLVEVFGDHLSLIYMRAQWQSFVIKRE